MDWKEIETAPKDGRHILACDASDGKMAVVCWQTADIDSGWLIATYTSTYRPDSDRWYSNHIYMDSPTHWMELPKIS